MSSNSKKTQVVTIILKPKSILEFNSIIPNLCEWLNRRKKNIQFLIKERARIEKIFKNIPNFIEFIDEDKVHNFSDLIITLGGDGTLIGASRQSTKHSPPIFGVNMGRLGFITEFSKNEIFEELPKFF